jgi:hypothetical protein
VNPQLLQLQIPEETLFSLRLAQDGHSFLAFNRLWTLV